MFINRSQLSYLIGLVTVLILINLFYKSYELYQYQIINQQIKILNEGEYVDAKSLDLNRVEIMIAYGALLHKLRLFDEAVEMYSRAEAVANTKQRTHIYYNLGNIYLKKAVEQAENLSVDQAISMAEVAKDFYQSALINEPGFWKAKYNFEAAQRLSRDLPLGDLILSEEGKESSTELWSAMPGFPVGLP
jgi:mxaK protein